MNITPKSFLPLFLIIIVFVFSFHIAILSFLEKPIFGNKIIESYFLNAFVAIFLYFIINKLKEKFKNSIGFIFILGSLIKFLLFFALIYPSFKVDGKVSKPEFTAFFVPYFVSLFYETLAIIKLLNSIEK
jgi:hypothetical protein